MKPNRRSAKRLFQETDNVSTLSLTKDSGKTGFNWNSLGTSGCKYMKNDHGQNVGAVSESLKEVIPPKAPSSLKMQSPSTPAPPITPGRLVTSTPMGTLKISNPFTPAPLVPATMSLTPLRISNKNESMHYFFSSSTQRNDNSRMTYQTMALLEDPSPRTILNASVSSINLAPISPTSLKSKQPEQAHKARATVNRLNTVSPKKNGDSSTVVVEVKWPSCSKKKELLSDLQSVGKMLCRGTYEQIANSVWRNKKLNKAIVKLILKQIVKECDGLCSKKDPSYL